MKIDEITIQVTYKVTIAGLDIDEEILDELSEACNKSIELESGYCNLDLATGWTLDNIREDDCFEWKSEVIEIVRS